MTTTHHNIDEDLAVCESEQLAWTGMIQGNGVLIVTDQHDQLLHYSENLSDFCLIEPAESSDLNLSQLFEDNTEYLRYRQHPIFEDSHFIMENVITNRGIVGDLVLSHHRGYRYYEFEPSSAAAQSDTTVGDAEIQVLPHDVAFDLRNLLQSIYELSGYSQDHDLPVSGR